MGSKVTCFSTGGYMVFDKNGKNPIQERILSCSGEYRDQTLSALYNRLKTNGEKDAGIVISAKKDDGGWEACFLSTPHYDPKHPEFLDKLAKFREEGSHGSMRVLPYVEE